MGVTDVAVGGQLHKLLKDFVGWPFLSDFVCFAEIPLCAGARE